MTVRAPFDVTAMAVVPSTPEKPGSPTDAVPSVEVKAIACAGGCWTPTAMNPAGDSPTPRNWSSARKWHGWQL